MAQVKDLKLYKENNKYYLAALIVHEDKNGIYEVSIPKIELPIKSECEINCTQSYMDKVVSIDFGFGELYAQPFDENDAYFTLTCLEEKIHKMTLPEIEKELGYKIELID